MNQSARMKLWRVLGASLVVLAGLFIGLYVLAGIIVVALILAPFKHKM